MLAPVAVSVLEPEPQSTDGLALTFKLMAEPILTLTVLVLLHPKDVPVTVYVVFEAGETVITDVLALVLHE